MVWIMAAVMVLMGLAMVAYMLVRRFFRDSREHTATPRAAFTLEELKRLHQQGQLSDDEYAALKEKMLRMAGKTD
jgi:uncharacterized membrane protein